MVSLGDFGANMDKDFEEIARQMVSEFESKFNTDVLTISKVWYVYNSNTKDWEFSAPDIDVQFKLKVELEEQKSVNGALKVR